MGLRWRITFACSWAHHLVGAYSRGVREDHAGLRGMQLNLDLISLSADRALNQLQ